MAYFLTIFLYFLISTVSLIQSQNTTISPNTQYTTPSPYNDPASGFFASMKAFYSASNWIIENIIALQITPGDFNSTIVGLLNQCVNLTSIQGGSVLTCSSEFIQNQIGSLVGPAIRAYVGYTILILITIIYAVILFPIGFIICCCRCCCKNCGGSVKPEDGRCTRWTRRICGLLLLVVVILITFFIVIGVISASDLYHNLKSNPNQTPGSNPLIIYSVQSVAGQMNNALGQVLSQVQQFNNTIASEIITPLNQTIQGFNFTAQLITIINKYGLASNISNAVSTYNSQYQPGVNRVCNAISSYSSTTSSISYNSQALQTATVTRCSNPAVAANAGSNCVILQYQLELLVNATSQASSGFSNSNSLNCSQFSDQLNQINNVYNLILANFSSQFGNVSSQVINQVSNFTSLINDPLNSVATLLQTVQSDVTNINSFTFDNITGDFKSYYITWVPVGYAAYTVIIFLVPVIVGFFTWLALAWGCWGRRYTKDPHQTCCNKCRGSCLICTAVTLVFCFALILGLIFLIVFLVPALPKTEICDQLPSAYRTSTRQGLFNITVNYFSSQLMSFMQSKLNQVDTYGSALANISNYMQTNIYAIVSQCGQGSNNGLASVIFTNGSLAVIDSILASVIQNGTSQAQATVNNLLSSNFPSNLNIVSVSQLNQILSAQSAAVNISQRWPATNQTISNATQTMLTLLQNITNNYKSSTDTTLQGYQANSTALSNQVTSFGQLYTSSQMSSDMITLGSDPLWALFTGLWYSANATQYGIGSTDLINASNLIFTNLTTSVQNIGTQFTSYLFYQFIPCKPFYEAYESAIDIPCNQILGPLITVAVCLGFYLILTIPLIICGLKLNALWRKTKSYEQAQNEDYEDEDDGSVHARHYERDLMQDGSETVPLNAISNHTSARVQSGIPVAPIYTPPHPGIGSHYAVPMVGTVFSTGSLTRRSATPSTGALPPGAMSASMASNPQMQLYQMQMGMPVAGANYVRPPSYQQLRN